MRLPRRAGLLSLSFPAACVGAAGGNASHAADEVGNTARQLQAVGQPTFRAALALDAGAAGELAVASNASHAAEEASDATAASPAFRAMRALGCDASCVHDGISATCRIRISWAEHHRFSGTEDACYLAHQMVTQRHCPVCSRCTLEAVSCKAPSTATTTASTFTTLPPPLALLVGDELAETHTATVTTVWPYDCDIGFSHWQIGWSHLKKLWCCHHAGRGCVASEAPTTTGAAAATTAALTTTTLAKRTTTTAALAAATAAERTATTAALTTTTAAPTVARATPTAAAAAPTTATATAAASTAAAGDVRSTTAAAEPSATTAIAATAPATSTVATTSSLRFDCNEEWKFWQSDLVGWSEPKRAWCCLHVKRGCPENATTSTRAAADSAVTAKPRSAATSAAAAATVPTSTGPTSTVPTAMQPTSRQPTARQPTATLPTGTRPTTAAESHEAVQRAATRAPAAHGFCCTAAPSGSDMCGTCWQGARAGPSEYCGSSRERCGKCAGAMWCGSDSDSDGQVADVIEESSQRRSAVRGGGARRWLTGAVMIGAAGLAAAVGAAAAACRLGGRLGGQLLARRGYHQLPLHACAEDEVRPAPETVVV